MAEHDRRLLHSRPILITTHANDRVGTYQRVHAAQVASTDSPKEPVGNPPGDVLNPEAAEILLDSFDAAIETGNRQYAESPVQFGDEEFWRGTYTASS
ncbi:MAG: hypothetical protein ABEJ73_00880 [Haloplanus sp.]